MTASVIARWADWDRYPGGRPFARPEVQELLAALSRSAVVVRGCRGVGKSTLLRLAAARLLAGGLSREEILYVDLEDPWWAPGPTIAGLSELLGAAAGVRVVLLDGVERLPGWADWARQMRGRRGVQVAAARTGPPAGEAPAGIEPLDCGPLDLGSWIGIFTDKKVDLDGARQALPGYLAAGGLPVARRAEGRRQALLDLFHESLLKDVLLLQPVRDVNALTAVAVYLLTHTGQPVSASRLKGRFTRSVDQARRFLAHLQAAGLITLVPRLEDARRPANQAARLCFAADCGLAQALGAGTEVASGGPVKAGTEVGSGGTEVDPGLCLTAVFHELRRSRGPVWAWRARGRQGLAAGDPSGPELLVDVQAGADCRLGSVPLRAAMSRTGCPQGLLLTCEPGAEQGLGPAGPGKIETRWLWSWLLELPTDSRVDKESVKITDKQVNNPSGGLPPHLL